MNDQIKHLAERLLHRGLEGLSERENHILSRIAARAHISRDVNRAFDEQMTVGERLADKVAEFGGSWTFIIIFAVFLIGWAVLNTIILISRPFDPYPFVFLNLILSMLAAVQAPIIMMSQNRQSAKDRLAATHDYEVNLKAELEIMRLHEKLDEVRTEQLGRLLEQQRAQLELLTTLVEARRERAT